MEGISQSHETLRRHFGSKPMFSDTPEREIDSIYSNTEDEKQWVQKVPSCVVLLVNFLLPADRAALTTRPITHSQSVTTIELDCIPTKSMHSVNTERFLQQSRGTNHTDGSSPSTSLHSRILVPPLHSLIQSSCATATLDSGAWPTEVKAEHQHRQQYVRRTYDNTNPNVSAAFNKAVVRT
jgi:hypothetical protein